MWSSASPCAITVTGSHPGRNVILWAHVVFLTTVSKCCVYSLRVPHVSLKWNARLPKMKRRQKKKKNVSRSFDAVIERTCTAFEKATEVEVPKDTSSGQQRKPFYSSSRDLIRTTAALLVLVISVSATDRDGPACAEPQFYNVRSFQLFPSSWLVIWCTQMNSKWPQRSQKVQRPLSHFLLHWNTSFLLCASQREKLKWVNCEWIFILLLPLAKSDVKDLPQKA